MIDCGFPLEAVRRQIEAAWSHLVQGKPITRLIVTHHHPDHIGNCPWICERWKLIPTITPGEHHRVQTIGGGWWDQHSRERAAFWRKHGLPEKIAAAINDVWAGQPELFPSLPAECNFIRDGDRIRIDNADWQVIVARGHAPAQALLHSPQRGLLLSGDQILAKITPNISVHFDAPEANPLALFLETNRRIAQACDDVLVVPSHNLPFRGLHARIREIEEHHQNRAAKVADLLRTGPHTAAEMIPVLFGDLTDSHEVGFAIGEAIAHLHHLVAQGRARSIERNGRIMFVAA